MKNQKNIWGKTNSHTERWTIAYIISMAIISIGWIIFYRANQAAPFPLGTHTGEGWWGWFDQGQYLRITNQFANGDFFNPNKYYPPLYPALPSAISTIIGSTSAYLITDLILCLTFFGGLFLNFRAYLSPLISLSGVILMYGITSITYEQWVIPWTTNLSSTMLIAISLLLNRVFYSGHAHTTWSNWSTSLAFFLTALMVWVRPFEIIPAFILCLGLLATQTKRVLDAHRPHASTQTARHLAQIVLGPCIAFTGTITIYMFYNLKTFGSWEPSYSKSINSMGFSPWDLGFKFISLATNSSTYGINNGHFSYYLPLFIPLILLGAMSLFFLAFPQKILISAAIINLVSYLSFNDLVPTGLFTFNNIHYFTWSLAVIGVSAITVLKVIIEKSLNEPSFRRTKLPALAGCWTITTILIINLQPNTDTIALSASQPVIICSSELADTSKIQNKAAQYQLFSNESPARESSAKTRLLELNIASNSNPSQVHLAHANQINLFLNNTEFNYRKDWRLVSKKSDQNYRLSILLHRRIKADDLSGILTIGQDSNIELSDVNFNQQSCYEKK